MDPFIESVVRRYPKLSYDENKGERHWISNPKYRGRLWLIPRRKGYFLQTTGQMGTHLNSGLESLCGAGVIDKHGYEYWKLVSQSEVENVIGWLAEI